MFHRCLDPKNDLAFKKIFGTEKHKRIPIDFLNAVLRLKGEDRIIDLEFLNPIQPPEIDARKESIVDVLVRDQKGTRYIVEMQVAKVEGFEKRAQYYAAKTYCSHFNLGRKYADLTKVIFLAITNYIVFPGKDRYKSDHVILDNEPFERDLKDFSFTFVELPKFTKENHDLKTIEDKWYYFLKHADESNNINEMLANHSEIKEAYEVLDKTHWTEEELQWYEKIAMNAADAQGQIDAAKNEGLEEGREEEKRSIAQMLLAEGMSVDQTSKVTGLDVNTIQALQNDLKNL